MLSIWDNWGDERGCDEGHWHAHTRGLPWGLPEVVGTVKVLCSRRRLFEGDYSFMCVLSIKVPIRKKSGNLFNDHRIYIYVCVCVCVCKDLFTEYYKGTNKVANEYLTLCKCIWSARGRMVIIVGSSCKSPSSNPEQGCLHFAWCW